MSTSLEIVRIPVLSDNYVWLMREPQSGCVGVVDPAVAGPVLAEAEKRHWKITHILNTHHHGDHVGGNREIKEATGCTIVGLARDRERIPGIDVTVNDGDLYRFGEAVAEVFFVPGHTVGHCAYAFREQKPQRESERQNLERAHFGNTLRDEMLHQPIPNAHLAGDVQK